MAESKAFTTQRAYTLRLRGAGDGDNSWREALWATHEAVNKGAKVFGDWLLTFRGGLCHTLADAKVHGRAGNPERDRTDEERRQRRILLALSWLSVESAPVDPADRAGFIVATGEECQSARDEKVTAALGEILSRRGVGDAEVKAWKAECKASLCAAIREDAVWVNRSAMFDAAVAASDGSLNREEVWDLLKHFFGSPESYFAGVKLKDTESDVGEADKGKDLVQGAGQWLSSRFGAGEGAKFEDISAAYGVIADWCDQQLTSSADSVNLTSLAAALGAPSAEGILRLISGPGYKSATRNKIKAWLPEGRLTPEQLKKLRAAARTDAEKCKAKIGVKGPRAWSDGVLDEVGNACGMAYHLEGGPARHKEFAVMLDHAARRVVIGHSWIKRAEAQRRSLTQDEQKLGEVPPAASRWLDAYCYARSTATGAIDGYSIRKRAISGWEKVVAAWGGLKIDSPEARVAAARELQEDPEIEKFGDIQLFEALAADGAKCVWLLDGNATPRPLTDYVIATDARARQQRFKVPAYRHPDPLSHPVFCDFGNSRWKIHFADHRPPKQPPTLSNRHVVSMKLWNGRELSPVDLRWACKRLAGDLALGQPQAVPAVPVGVTRADRLGRAAADAPGSAQVRVLNVFEEKYWNGRLQAPRAQLNALSRHIAKNGWDAKAMQMRHRIRWIITLSAKLQPTGPWHRYAERFPEESPAKPFFGRSGDCGVKHESNKSRQGNGKLILSRLPGLRLLSVDLGHRYAAACAVWEAITTESMAAACTAAGVPRPKESDLYLHLATSGADGKRKTVIYRRVGPDKLPDGTDHPAPWAKLDRQFLIKLPGEELPPRAASNSGDSSEIQQVAAFAKRLGLEADDERSKGRAVDELMSRAVHIATLGLKRHARRAKIAYALNPETKSIPGAGGHEKSFTVGDDNHIKFLTDALFDWYTLATESKWRDRAASDLWNRHIAPIANGWQAQDLDPTDGAAENPTGQQRRKDDDPPRERFRPVARTLASADRRAMHADWKEYWQHSDGRCSATPKIAPGQRGPATTAPSEPATGWHAELRWITDWIMGRRLPGCTGEGWKHRVGGLSVTRVTTMKSLYQLQKAFAMRARPERPRGAPKRGESNFGVAQGILSAMESMRQQRARQLASRIVEAALGVGIERSRSDGRDPQRPRARIDAPRFAACHAVVIENLNNYRPDEMQTRRENRQLMQWASSKVKKYLSESCQLHGLHLREVQAAYTSRQDSRTGAPGVRCKDVPVDEFTTAPWWRSRVGAACRKREGNGSGTALDRYLLELDQACSQLTPERRKAAPPIRIPVRGGDIFVSADPSSPAAGGLHADLNAAANIGLKALLDPDWPGKWWYIPCETATHKPHTEKVKGCAAVDCGSPLGTGAPTPAGERPLAAKPKARSGKAKQEIVNLWRDPTHEPPINTPDRWAESKKYWNQVECRVIGRLAAKSGSGESS